MLKPIKQAGLRITGALAINSLVRNSRWRRRRVAILCYHGVSLNEEHEWDPRYYISPATLERRFQILRNNYNVLPLGEAVRRLYEGTLPARSVAITFDDGCYDFYRQAFPLLKKFELPATVYLTTFYCRHPKPVFEMFCHYLVWKGRNTFPGGLLLDQESTPDLTSEAGRRRVGAAVVTSARRRGLSLAEKDALAEELARQLGVDYRAAVSSRILQLMTPDEVTEVASAGIDIQLHTHRHRVPAGRDAFFREIADNRRSIREMTGSDAATVHFCYPSGDYRPDLLPWLKDQGIVSATTCETGLAGPRQHPLLLPRVTDTGNLTQIEWEGWLDGVSEAVRCSLRATPGQSPPRAPRDAP